MRDRRHLLIACAALGMIGVLALPTVAVNWYAAAVLLFFWGGVVAALYTIGLAHLGSRLSGQDLASANAAFRPSRDRPIRLRRRSLRPCAGAPGSGICSGAVGRTDIERPR